MQLKSSIRSHKLIQKLEHNLMTFAFCVFVILGLSLISIRGSIHDYVAYEKQWKYILSGSAHMAKDNVYGPLHYFFAYVWKIHPQAPKVTWFLLLAIAVFPLFLLAQERLKFWQQVIFLVFVPFNFLTLSISSSFGLNDTLVASLVLLGTISLHRKLNVLSGIVFGLSILLKFYPIIFLGFLMFRNKVLNIKFAIASTLTTISGFTLGFLIWGKTIFNLFEFGSNREPKYLNFLGSIFYFNERVETPYFKVLANLNIVILISISFLVFLFSLVSKLDMLLTGFTTFFVFLVLYKGAAEQYFLPWVLLWGYLFVSNNFHNRAIAKSSAPFVALLSIFALGYEIFSGYFRTGFFVRQNIGFMATALGVYLASKMFKEIFSERKLLH